MPPLLPVTHNADNKTATRDILNSGEYENISTDTVNMINEYTGAKISTENAEGGCVNMGNAWKELMDDIRIEALTEGRTEGRIEGQTKGEEKRLVKQICRKLRKGKNLAQIADDLEENESNIKAFFDTAAAFAPDYDEDKVIKAMFG